jgi:N-terminal acetyltransferase B complex non-catalytic subunit
MSLQSNFPKTRKYYFWAIFLSYLVAVDKNSSEAERKLFGTLAYRMASKAADSVPADPVRSTFPFSLRIRGTLTLCIFAA